MVSATQRMKGCRLLSQRTETLQKYFEQFGKINQCQIMRDQLGRSRGFAFLTFDNSDSVNAVMSQQHTVDGKVVSRRILQANYCRDIDPAAD